MFKFIRKGPQPSFERQKLQRELFAYRKVSVSLNIESFFKYLIRNFEFSLSNVRLFFIEIRLGNFQKCHCSMKKNPVNFVKENEDVTC